jgi:hypothetical protein
MDIEWALLCKVVESDIRPVLDARITRDYFADPDNGTVFSWMVDHWNNHGASPGTDALHHAFPRYTLVPTQEPLSYYVEQMRERHRYALVLDMLDRTQEPLKAGDAASAIKILAHGLEATHSEVSDLHDIDLCKTTEARLAFYASLSNQEGMRGIPTGFPGMDRATAGLQPEQLISIVGTSKVGKSVIILAMCIAAHASGHKPMFITFEMSTQEQSMRHDTFRAGVSYNRLANGSLWPHEQRKLGQMMAEMEDLHPMLFVHDPSSTTTVSALGSKVSQHRPDILFVDGAYMIDAEVQGVEPNSAQALTSVTRSLKRLAQRAGIPIVISTQALTWKSKRGLKLDSIGYSSSFGQDSDVVFGLEETDDKAERVLKIIAARNTTQKEIRLRFDWDMGAILEMGEVEYEADDDETDDS